MKKIQFEPIQSKNILNAVKAPSLPFDWSINPYRGCQHGCSFCYARSTHSFLGKDTDDTFQHHIFYKENAPEALEAQLVKMLRTKDGRTRLGRVAIGTATDPYQPLESRAQLTRQCLDVLAKHQVPVTITTRSPLILKDAELIKTMEGSSVNISINTLDMKVWRDFEPMTPSPKARFDTVKRLCDHGIEAGIFLAPAIPYITDGEDALESVVRSAAQSGTAFVMGSMLRLSTPAVKSWFFATLREHYPHLVEKYASMYYSSGYAPNRYRESFRAKLKLLLDKYNIPGYEPFTRREQSKTSGNEGPVQLSFSFGGECSENAGLVQ